MLPASATPQLSVMAKPMAAEIDVETLPVALRIRHAEAGEAGVRAAIQDAALLDLRERGLSRGPGRGQRHADPRRQSGCNKLFHRYSPVGPRYPADAGRYLWSRRRRHFRRSIQSAFARRPHILASIARAIHERQATAIRMSRPLFPAYITCEFVGSGQA